MRNRMMIHDNNRDGDDDDEDGYDGNDFDYERP